MSTTKDLGLLKQSQIYKKTIKIYGPPGTGKTHTLIERILKRYLDKGVHPMDIAFTPKNFCSVLIVEFSFISLILFLYLWDHRPLLQHYHH